MSDLARLSIREAGEGLAAGRFSANELLDATFDRIRETEPLVHAFETLMESAARAEAWRADAELQSGSSRGPLHGIPVSVKDLCWTEGTRTSAGSDVLDDFVPKEDAVVVTRLRTAGAVIVGKTVTHEFAYGQNVPPTRNPWDLECYPGGSSAGSGVAVAVGSSFGAVGTDTGGSIRVPAAVNGVVGLKPTAGRVPRHGVFPMSPTLDTVGPLTRTVYDNALMLAVMAGVDVRDTASFNEPVPNYVAGLNGSLKGIRLGVERRHFFHDHMIPEATTAMEDAFAVLRDLGAEIVDIEIPELAYVSAVGMSILVPDTSEWHRELLRTRGERYVQATRIMLELGELVPAAPYVRAQRARAALRDIVRRTFDANRLTGMVASTLPMTTIPVEELGVDLSESGETALGLFLHHTFLANVIGIPALSVPCGFADNGRPLGLQLFGRPFAEQDLFRIGHAYQGETDWHERRPSVG